MKAKLLAAALASTLVQPAMAGQTIKTIFVIAMENHNFTQPSSYTSLNPLFGNIQAAPYLNSLITPGSANAAQVSYASNYHNVIDANGADVHPSEPNYVWAEAGVHGPLNDATPYPSNLVNAPSFSAALGASGQSWRSYQEDIDLARNGSSQVTSTVLPRDQWTVPTSNLSGTSSAYTNAYNGSHQYDYAAKHDPQVFFTATNGGTAGSPDPSTSNPQAQNYVPLQQLAADLAANSVAQYNWITPDQFNDMHTTLANGFDYNGVHLTGDQARIAQGDNFLSQIVPLIMASQAYQDNGAIIIWNDETEGNNASNFMNFTNTEIVISPLAKGNAYNSTLFYDHSSDLKTMQEIFGVTGTRLGAAATANDLSDLFVDGAIPAAPEPASWAMMVVGFGALGGAMRKRRTRMLPA